MKYSIKILVLKAESEVTNQLLAFFNRVAMEFCNMGYGAL